MDTTNLAFSDLGVRGAVRAAARAGLISASALFLVAATGEASPTMGPDSRLIYVSSSSGDDANDGLSPASPKQSLAGAATALRDGYPDWVFLRRGDTWYEGFAPFDFSGRSEDEPIVITAYGPGSAEPMIRPEDPREGRPDEPFTTSYGVDFPVVPDDGGDGGGSEGPILSPGSGWAGPTQQPQPVGTPDQPGFDAKAIARWDVVPNQTFEGALEIGVVAFHMNGIERIDFSVDGGPWESVYEMSLNPRTGVWEYWASLDASLHASDGEVEVRAIAWPEVGEPRVLDSLHLFTNTGGSLPHGEVFVSPLGDDDANDGTRSSPYQSVFKAAMALQSQFGGRADGGVISLLPGEYSWGPAGRDANGRYIGNLVTQDRWLEIRPAGGVDRSEVVFTTAASGGLKTGRVHLKDVTLRASPINSVQSGTSPTLWIEGCEMIAASPMTDTRWANHTGFPGGIYVTESSVQNGRYGILNAKLVRNIEVQGIGDDAFTNNQMVINATVRDQWIPAGSGYHSDVVQMHASDVPHDNVIIYNVWAIDCGSQPWHIGYTGHRAGPDWTNIAFVNYFVENELEGMTAQWCVSAEHVLWWHLGVLGGPVVLRDSPNSSQPAGPTSIRNFSVRNSIFEKFSSSSSGGFTGIGQRDWAVGNHFIDTSSYGAQVVGANASGGGSFDELFFDSARNDYRPMSTLLRDRIDQAVIPADAKNKPSAGAIGPLQPTEE